MTNPFDAFDEVSADKAASAQQQGNPFDAFDAPAPTPMAAPAAPPPEPGIGHKLGLGVRNVAQGVIGPAYDLIGSGLSAAGIPINRFAENLTALGLPQAETPFERGASAIIEPVAATLTGQGVGRAMMGATSPVAQAVGGALTTAPATQAVSAGVGGAVQEATGSPTAGMVAGVGTALAGGGLGAAGRAISGGSGGASAADAALGKLAIDKYKIPIEAPDLTSNSAYRIGADQMGKLPFSGAAPAAAEKHGAWLGAIAREMGENVKAFTSDVMDRARLRIGQAFDDVAGRTTIPQTETAPLLRDLQAILPQAEQVLTEAELRPLTIQIQNIAERVGKSNGTITGDAYRALTRSKAPLDLAERSTNPNVAHYAGQIRDALDDAFVRSAAPADQAALTQAKYQYRVMRTVDPLVAGSRDGTFTPDAFMQKVLTASRRFDAPTGGMAYTGGGNIGELAKIGKLMRAPPQTGSADRAAVNFGTAALMGGSFGLNPWMIGTVPATLGANRMLGGYLRSEGLANRLIDSSLNPRTGLQSPAITAGVVGLQNRLQRDRQD